MDDSVMLQLQDHMLITDGGTCFSWASYPSIKYPISEKRTVPSTTRNLGRRQSSQPLVFTLRGQYNLGLQYILNLLRVTKCWCTYLGALLISEHFEVKRFHRTEWFNFINTLKLPIVSHQAKYCPAFIHPYQTEWEPKWYFALDPTLE